LLSRIDKLERAYKGLESHPEGMDSLPIDNIEEEDYCAWERLFTKLQQVTYTGGYSQNCQSFFNFTNGNNRSECDAKKTTLKEFVDDQRAVNTIQLPIHPKCTSGDCPKYYGQPTSWKDIKCRTQKLSKGLIIKTTCKLPKGGESDDKDPGKYKIFVCGFKNLYDYGNKGTTYGTL
jgi:hypothetical protein